MSESRGPSVWNIVSMVLAVAGIAAAFWFYFASKRERALCFSVAPERTRIVDASEGAVAGLGVTYNGEPVQAQNITGVLVYVWNAGREPIRAENALLPVAIQLGPEAEVLDVRLTRSPRREVTQFADPSWDARSNKVDLAWRILERGDGAALQMTYAGPPDSPVKVVGAVEGQRHIIRRELPVAGEDVLWGDFAGTTALTVTAALMAWFGVYMVVLRRARGRRLADWMDAVRVLVGSALVLGLALSLLAGFAWRFIYTGAPPAHLLP